jgi:ankyrin repeat protein
MDWRRIAGLSLLIVGFAGASVAADKAPLADAAEGRNKALVRTLLDSGADVNAAQVDGMTALHWAVYNDDVETAALLVRKGANANAANRYGVPPLSLASTNGNAELVKLLLEAGANANVTLQGGETVLMTAARAGSVEAVKALLSHGANPNARERMDQTALMWAAAEGHAAVVRALIDGKADVNATLKSGFTPFFFAVREGHIDVVRALLAGGVDVNQALQRQEGERQPGAPAPFRGPVAKGTSALSMAVLNGHFELAIALVDAGADPNDHRTGYTPLHMITWVRKPDASDTGDPAPIGSGRLTSLQFVRALAERGANVNARIDKGVPRPPGSQSRLGVEGATPFLMASDRADILLMRLLLELKADPSLPNADGSTPLMAAAGLGTAAPDEEAGGAEPEALEAVQLLLGLGADVNAVDKNGDTAMHGAAYGNFPKIVKLLADRGARSAIWKLPNAAGSTPLFIAEGHRYGRPIVSRPTIDAILSLMKVENLPTDGVRPVFKDIYEKAPEPPQKTQKP